MSTRCQVVLTDNYGQSLWFYKHSDGYPEGTMPLLEKFLGWVKEGKIRDNVEQSGGWLILIGAQEYGDKFTSDGKEEKKSLEELFNPSGNDSMGWKCGAFEPCACREKHGDIEYLYTIDLKAMTIKTEECR